MIFDFDEAENFLKENNKQEFYHILKKAFEYAKEYDYVFMFLQEEEGVKKTF